MQYILIVLRAKLVFVQRQRVVVLIFFTEYALFLNIHICTHSYVILFVNSCYAWYALPTCRRSLTILFQCTEQTLNWHKVFKESTFHFIRS